MELKYDPLTNLRMKKFDPTTLEIYRALYTSVAEEMGVTLRRTAFSPNIKERRDYSCAVFDSSGRVIAQGDHMPVHLGSMPMAVAAALREVQIGPGDVVAVNDPFAGGTHLPDVTLVSSVVSRQLRKRNNGQLTTDDGRFFTSPIAPITRILAGLPRVRWGWPRTSMAKACEFRQFASSAAANTVKT